MFPLWPFSVTIEVGNLSATFMEKVVWSKIYLRGGVLKMHVLYLGEERDGSPHDGVINFLKKKLWKSVYKSKIDFLG